MEPAHKKEKNKKIPSHSQKSPQKSQDPWLVKYDERQRKKKLDAENRKVEEAKKKIEDESARKVHEEAEKKKLKEKLSLLQKGETFVQDSDNTYRKLFEQEALDLFKKIENSDRIPDPQSEIDFYAGKLECPLCGQKQILEYLNFGFAGCDCWGYKKVVCSDPKCGIYYDFHTNSKD